MEINGYVQNSSITVSLWALLSAHAKAGCTLQTAAATATVGNSMATASAAMASVGQAANPAKMQQTMQQFAKENAKMDMASEMMGDAVDDALDDDEVEDETDDLMNQVNARFLNTLARSLLCSPCIRQSMVCLYCCHSVQTLLI